MKRLTLEQINRRLTPPEGFNDYVSMRTISVRGMRLRWIIVEKTSGKFVAFVVNKRIADRLAVDSERWGVIRYEDFFPKQKGKRCP